MGLSKKDIREMAILQASAPDLWSDDKLCTRYCCTSYSLRKAKSSDTWVEVAEFIPYVLPFIHKKQDLIFSEKFEEDLDTWAERRKRQVAVQLELGNTLGRSVLKAMQDFDNTLESIKQYGPAIKSMVSAWKELSQEASEVEKTVFALEEILDRISENKEKQTNLFN